MTSTDQTSTHRSTGDLMSQASQQLAQLAREEVHLAQLEVAQKSKKAGIGVGLLGGGGLIALYAVGCLIAAAVLGLSTVLSGWLAALIVGGGLLAIAAVAALVGKRETAQGLPPLPTGTPAELRADLNAVKKGLHS